MTQIEALRNLQGRLKDSNGFLRYSTAPLLNVPQYGDTPYSTGNPSSNPTSYSPIGNMPYLANKAPYPIQ